MFRQDLRFALRTVVRNPGFTLILVVILGLGIGATSSIVSVADAALLHGIPYTDPDRLVLIQSFDVRSNDEWPVSYLDVRDWQERTDIFESVSAYTAPQAFNLLVDGEPDSAKLEMVSAEYFALLDQKPVYGRTFTPEEDRPPGGRVVVVSYGFWRSHLGGEAQAVGKTLKLSDQPYTIVGVMPKGFQGLTDEAQLWLPISAAGNVLGGDYFLGARSFRWMYAVARLAPGVSPAQAGQSMGAFAEHLRQEYPDANANAGAAVVPLTEAWLGDLRQTLSVLLGAAALVLVLACANIANLLLVRAAGRQREIALRISLGSGRWRLIRQLLTENIVVSLAGCTLGLLIALFGTDTLVALSGAQLRSFVEPSLNGWVIAAMVAVSLLCGLGFGTLPAILTSQAQPAQLLRAGRQSVMESRRPMQWLVIAQVALALALVVGAGMLIERLRDLQSTDLGFDSRNLLTMRLDLKGERYEGLEPRHLRVFLDKLHSVPGADSLAIAGPTMPTDDWNARGFTIEGRPADEELALLSFHYVSPEYFSTLKVPFLDGRDFTYQDTDSVAPVVILSEPAARRYWPGENPIGKRLKTGRLNDTRFDWLTVVGVVPDLHQNGLREEPNRIPDVYYCLLQKVPFFDPTFNFIVRPPSRAVFSLVAPLRQAVLDVDPALPIFDVATMEERLASQITNPNSAAFLSGLFAVLALILAALGVYGVIRYVVASRRHEIAIRMALGAQRAEVLKMVLLFGLRLAAAGLVIGLVGAWGLSRLFGSFLEDISVADPTLWLGATLVVLTVAAAASFLPARGATRIEPMTTLRSE